VQVRLPGLARARSEDSRRAQKRPCAGRAGSWSGYRRVKVDWTPRRTAGDPRVT